MRKLCFKVDFTISTDWFFNQVCCSIVAHFNNWPALEDLTIQVNRSLLVMWAG